jgi:hypothetical protein
VGFQKAEQLLQAWGIKSPVSGSFLEPDFQAWAPGKQCSSTADIGKPSLWVVGARGPTCQHRLPGTMVAAAEMGASLQVTGVLGPDYWHRLQGAQFSGTAAGSREPSLQAVGVLGPDCHMGFREHSTVLLLPALENQTCWFAHSVM